MAARPSSRPSELIDGATGAHRRLVDHLSVVTDDVVRQPSLLPGWSVGHVLTHLARNADSFTHVLTEAAKGNVVAQYPGGSEQRDGDIERGSGRRASELVDDVRQASTRLEAMWASTSDEVWANGRTLAFTSGEVPLADTVFRRWRETEVHHADLGLDGFGYDDWSSAYVRRDLDAMTMAWRASRPMGLTNLPAAANALSPNRRLAWLLGRLDVDGLERAGVF